MWVLSEVQRYPKGMKMGPRKGGVQILIVWVAAGPQMKDKQ